MCVYVTYIPRLWVYWIFMSCCRGDADWFISILISKRSVVSVAHYAFGISFKYKYYHLILEAKNRQIFSLNIYNVLIYNNYKRLSRKASISVSKIICMDFGFDGRQDEKKNTVWDVFETLIKYIIYGR